MRRTAALIVGGGPAGSAAAITLAAGGLRPLLVERDRKTGDALCGGFLSWHTLETLAGLGLDPQTLGGASIDRVRLFAGRHRAEARLPARAIGVSRRTLDSALIEIAARQGVGVERGVGVREGHGDGRVRLDDGGEIAADSLLLATGKHELRGLARPRDAAGDDPALGLRVHLDAAPALTRIIDGAIELHLFDRGYAGLCLQEDGRVNLCLAVRKSRLAEAGGKPARLLDSIGRECPALGERLAWLPDDATPDAIAAVPYGWRNDVMTPGLLRLGDQAGVIPSLAGEGVGIALASGVMAARALLEAGPAGAVAFQRRFRRRLARPVGTASVVLALAERPDVAPWMARAMGAMPGAARMLARMTRMGPM
jgi:flavin-dependent dehydrogenase